MGEKMPRPGGLGPGRGIDWGRLQLGELLEEGPVVAQGITQVLGVGALLVPGAAQRLLPLLQRTDQRVRYLGDEIRGLGDRARRVVHEGRLDPGPVIVQFSAVGDQGRRGGLDTGGAAGARGTRDGSVRLSGGGGGRGGGAGRGGRVRRGGRNRGRRGFRGPGGAWVSGGGRGGQVRSGRRGAGGGGGRGPATGGDVGVGRGLSQGRGVRVGGGAVVPVQSRVRGDLGVAGGPQVRSFVRVRAETGRTGAVGSVVDDLGVTGGVADVSRVGGTGGAAGVTPSLIGAAAEERVIGGLHRGTVGLLRDDSAVLACRETGAPGTSHPLPRRIGGLGPRPGVAAGRQFVADRGGARHLHFVPG